MDECHIYEKQYTVYDGIKEDETNPMGAKILCSEEFRNRYLQEQEEYVECARVTKAGLEIKAAYEKKRKDNAEAEMERKMCDDTGKTKGEDGDEGKKDAACHINPRNKPKAVEIDGESDDKEVNNTGGDMSPDKNANMESGKADGETAANKNDANKQVDV